jgi:Fic family protein
MYITPSILLSFAVGIVIGILFVYKKSGTHGKNRQQKQKDVRKAKIMELFATRFEVKNNDVERMFAVSDATATNYLSELEKEGKIKQAGSRGRFVTYEKFKG